MVIQSKKKISTNNQKLRNLVKSLSLVNVQLILLIGLHVNVVIFILILIFFWLWPVESI